MFLLPLHPFFIQNKIPNNKYLVVSMIPLSIPLYYIIITNKNTFQHLYKKQAERIRKGFLAPNICSREGKVKISNHNQIRVFENALIHNILPKGYPIIIGTITIEERNFKGLIPQYCLDQDT